MGWVLEERHGLGFGRLCLKGDEDEDEDDMGIYRRNSVERGTETCVVFVSVTISISEVNGETRLTRRGVRGETTLYVFGHPILEYFNLILKLLI